MSSETSKKIKINKKPKLDNNEEKINIDKQ